MEFRSQEDESGMPVSLGYNPPPFRESAFTKPSPSSSSSSLLSPRGGGGGGAGGARNGNGFDPITTTVSHTTTTINNPLNLPAPIAICATSGSGGGAGGSNPRTPLPPPTPTTKPTIYKECLRNHAANVGGHVVDGCGEFMPSGEVGTIEAVKCAACGCHRSFHRREIPGEPSNPYYNNGRNTTIPLLLAPPHPHRHKQFPVGFPASPSGVVHGSSAVMAFGGNHSGSGTTESSSEELNVGAGAAAVARPVAAPKKRHRTKFTAEQKEKMLGFAERVGWRVPKRDDVGLEQFCVEIGVKRQVLKVWMHNNKHFMKKQQELEQQNQQNQQS